jgi:hypothetical protein
MGPFIILFRPDLSSIGQRYVQEITGNFQILPDPVNKKIHCHSLSRAKAGGA